MESFSSPDGKTPGESLSPYETYKVMSSDLTIFFYPFLGFVPGFAWLAYLLVGYRSSERSFSKGGTVFLLGAVCTMPALFFLRLAGGGMGHDSLLRAAYSCFVVTGPIEELFKLIAVWVGVYRSSEFRDPMDGIVYAVTSALGFAGVENYAYIGEALSRPDGLTLQGLMDRALFATPAHVLFAVLWGYALGVARFRREGEMRIIAIGLGLSAIFHGGYDFLAELLVPLQATVWLVPYLGFMGFLMYGGIRKFRKGYPLQPVGEGVVVLCAGCGAYVAECDDECPRCGTPVDISDEDTPRFCGRCRAKLRRREKKCPRCGEHLTMHRACAVMT